MHFPSVSLARALTGGAARRHEAQTLARACRETGFFFLVDHGIPQQVWDGLFPASRRFFELPGDAKAEVHYSRARVWPGDEGGFPVRGYLRPDEERLGPLPTNKPDAKEAWDMADELPAGGRLAPYHGPNLWPSALPGAAFREPVVAYHAAVKRAASDLRALVCEALGWPPTALDALYAEDTHVMRLLHYPPRPAGVAEPAQPCAAHTDQGCFTLLKQDAAGGLQAKLAETGAWVDVPARTDALAVNVGDTLCAWTNGAFRSTVHRVVPAGDGAERFSCGFFYDPAAGTALLRGSAASDADLVNNGIVNLLHKAGLPQDQDGVRRLRNLTFAEYKHSVFTKFRPDARPNARTACGAEA